MSSKPSLSPKQLLSLDQTYEGNSAEKEIPAGSINNASSSKPLSQDSATSTSSETVDLVARLAQMTLAIGALVTEVGETNRTLKALVAEKHVEKGKDASNEIQYNPVPTSLLRPNQVPPQEARMQILRDTFLKGASDRPQDQLAGYVSEPGYSGFFLGFEGAMLIVCTNETRTPLEGDKGSKPLNSRHFKTTAQSQKVPKITECLDLIRSKWPLNTVSTDGDKILWRVISTDSMDCHLQLFDQISSGGLAVPESIVFPWDDSRQPRVRCSVIIDGTKQN
jgi:hypothetical protein